MLLPPYFISDSQKDILFNTCLTYLRQINFLTA
uniref:Uncharacterized protein n=1 Tax=Lepeophtheirus salmonis TaxID=72036 RepID=A0A0K2U1R2_LEPSM